MSYPGIPEKNHKDSSDRIQLVFSINNGYYKNDKRVLNTLNFNITATDQQILKGEGLNATSLVLPNSYDFYRLDCNITSTLEFKNSKGIKEDITYNNWKDLTMYGKIKSTGKDNPCSFSVDFEGKVKYVNIVNVLLYTLVVIAFYIWSLIPLIKAILFENYSILSNLGFWTLSINMAVDVTNLFLLMILGRIIDDYEQFFTNLLLFLTIAFVLKFHILYYFKEQELLAQNLEIQDIKTKLCYFNLKLIFCSVIIYIIAIRTIDYYYLFLFFMINPSIQVINNMLYVL
ncbi:MAG: hypothetical protein GY823_10990 [Flavobacteriaceae bacterium]|nr:hypothetical protein [Flavobacteriaceae bacterium]